ncbi:UDP-2,4-diacetamido-2,4,6-trideoxy-beta-L-altropyranose hydrolase [Maridesulfovibrio sp.]|uniref:UDP-2,4-diacetamido-2,4, 6-trideoxy-beta-L-altropyranose hydrolase n=1 Tax=Maridesulfovibrio sp. TaxID=2795000 RepID=UPI0029CA9271|nr:UDP-2,4-diacetamido-2,4,6-trideoxy-beta-L-altropyranose hydrolase [Maridesulfovibrio sp.]
MFAPTTASLKDKELIIRADADPRIGIGHVMRCLALADEWIGRGGKAVLVGKIEGDPIKERIKSFAVDMVELEASYPESSIDLTTLLEQTATAPEGSWIVLDGYFLDHEYQRRVMESFQNLLVIDDYCHHEKYFAAAILNPDPGAELFDYPVDRKTALLTGPEYALLRKEFRSTGQDKNRTVTGVRKVLITMGGADAENVSLTALKALDKIEEKLDITVVAGPANPHKNSLDDFGKQSKQMINLLSNVQNMAELITAQDLVISAGGSTCLEVCALARPLVIAVTAENQSAFSNELANYGAAINTAELNDESEERIFEAVNNLIGDDNLRQALIDKASRIVDGLGTARIVDFLNSPVPSPKDNI